MKANGMTGFWQSTISARLMTTTCVLIVLSLGLAANVGEMVQQRGYKDDHSLRFAEIALRLEAGHLKRMAERYDPSAVGHEATAELIRRTRSDGDHWFQMVCNANSSLQKGAKMSLPELRGKWETINASVNRLLAATSTGEASAITADLSEQLKHIMVSLKVDGYDDASTVQPGSEGDWSDRLQVFLCVCMVGMAMWTYYLGRNISKQAQTLTDVVQRIAAGELDLKADVSGHNELATIAEAFNDMTDTVRGTLEARERLIESIQQGSVRLSSATLGVVTSTRQHVKGSQEQAAAIAETVAAVEEVEQTTRQSAARAAAVAESSQLALDNGQAGRKAVEDSISAMQRVRHQVESIAENILTLAEQAQNIGEIVSSVDHIADQTNLLALNAAIEAARAGEQGKGFTVVANEIRLLADQSKRATVQVRQMLSGIQKLTQRSVLSMEDGTRSVTEATSVVSQADDTIRELVETVTLAATSAGQILNSANQQSVGMRQIHQAMKNIQEIATDTLSATQKAESAVHELNSLAESLNALLHTNGQHASVDSVVASIELPMAVAVS